MWCEPCRWQDRHNTGNHSLLLYSSSSSSFVLLSSGWRKKSLPDWDGQLYKKEDFPKSHHKIWNKDPDLQQFSMICKILLLSWCSQRWYTYYSGSPTAMNVQKQVGWGTWLEVLTIKNIDTDIFTKKGLSIVTICKIRNTDPYIQPKSNNAPLKVLWKESDNITKFIRL